MRRLAVFVVAMGLVACDDGGERTVLVIGDSIMNQSAFDTAAQLEDAGWQPVLDAIGGSEVQPDQPFDVDWAVRVRQLRRVAEPELAVVELGTNDCLSDERGLRQEIDSLLQELDGIDQVIWLTPPTLDCDRFDDQLFAAADRYDNLAVVDAGDHFEGHPEWIAADGIHLSPRGRRELARYVERSSVFPI